MRQTIDLRSKCKFDVVQVGQIYFKKRGVHPSKSPKIARIFATFLALDSALVPNFYTGWTQAKFTGGFPTICSVGKLLASVAQTQRNTL